MADKVSLVKDYSHSELQEINKKLDFLISEITDIRREMKDLKTQNSDDLYQLSSRFYKLCSDLQSQSFDFQTKLYNGNKNVSKQLQDLQTQAAYSRFANKSFSFSTMMFCGIMWLIFMILIFD